MARKPTYEELELTIKALEKEAFERNQEDEFSLGGKDFAESIIDSLPGIFYLFDENGKFIRWNQNFQYVSEYSAEEISKMNPLDFFVGEDQRHIAARIQDVFMQGNASAEAHFVSKNGNKTPYFLTGLRLKIGGANYLSGMGIDLTDRKEAEAALRESEEKYRMIVENQSDLVVKVDIEGRFLFVSPSYCEVFDKTENELLGEKFMPLVHEDDQASTAKAMEDLYRPPYACHLEQRALTKNGWRWLAWADKAVHDEENNVVAVVGVGRDITERKQAEDQLKQSEEKYRDLVNNTTDLFYRTDMEGKIIFISPSVHRLSGYTVGEAIGMKMAEEVYANPHERAHFLAKLKQNGYVENFEAQLKRKDGSLWWASTNAHFFKDHNGNIMGVEGTTRDIAEQKKVQKEREELEIQLRRAQKMESMGTLAGGVAHDFNNLLMSVQGRASIMMMGKDTSHPDFEHLKGIEDCVESAAGLTRQLLGFAKGGKYEVRLTDLNELIKKENRMFGRTKKEIVIRGGYEKHLWPVEIDRGQIEQVLLNLYVNAWQAMPNGGTLHITTRNVTLDEDCMKRYQVEPGKYVQISVADTGVGMDKTVRERVFDPFFTTKDLGRGTGLGLASAYGIIKNHGGFFNVYSEKGHGSTFNFYLPASDKEIAKEKKTESVTLSGYETILFVDDEEMITEVAEELFEQLGYRVFVAGSGKEAVKLYEQNKERIDMVVLDMIMPDMGGGETFDRMKIINPEVKVLLSSGYSIDGQADEILARGCSGFIQKPFKIKELSQKLRNILDEP